MTQIQMCENCGFDEPAVEYDEYEGHMCKDCHTSWQNSYKCEDCNEWQEDQTYEGRCVYCQRMYEGECEVRCNGWKQVLEDYDEYDLENFEGAAKKWESCVIGEILGFPDSTMIAGQLPYELRTLAEEFSRAVGNGCQKDATKIYGSIQEWTPVIRKIAV